MIDKKQVEKLEKISIDITKLFSDNKLTYGECLTIIDVVRASIIQSMKNQGVK